MPSNQAPEDLAKYQGGPEDAADYRHRMLVNAAGFLFVLVLIGLALWLADSMAKMRKDQNCVLMRRECPSVQINRDRQ